MYVNVLSNAEGHLETTKHCHASKHIQLFTYVNLYPTSVHFVPPKVTLYVGRLVSWCFKPSQPQRIVSGLKETFLKRHIVEKTDKAEIRPEEQSEKAESCRENLWNEMQLKRP